MSGCKRINLIVMVMKKRHLFFLMLPLVALLIYVTPSSAEQDITSNSGPSTGASQQGGAGSSIGWIGLLGLAGLLGLRRKNGSTTSAVRSVVIATGLLTSGALLSGLPVAYGGQSDYQGDHLSKTSQRDIEDHETKADWVGLFGLAGLVGIIGPKRDHRH